MTRSPHLPARRTPVPGRPRRGGGIAAVLVLALVAGCTGDGRDGHAATLAGDRPATTAGTSSPEPPTSAPASASASASPESERARARRLAWAAAIDGVALEAGRLTVVDPLGPSARPAAEQAAAEALATNRRTDLVAARVRLVRAAPDVPARWNDLGDALVMADRLDLAEGAFRTAADRAGVDAEAARAGLALARAAARRGDFAGAVDRMRSALALEEDGDGHARLAVWLTYLGDRQGARTAAAEADRLGGRVPAAIRARLDADGDADG